MHNIRHNTARPVYALISIANGPEDDAEILGTYYVTEKSLADAIDASEGLDVYQGDIKSDKSYRMPYGVNEIPHLIVERKNVPTYVSRRRSVACCAYNATNEFLQHWLGMKLDNDDRGWYEQNSLVTEDGLPQANTFTVIQQLAEPYGAGISRIAVPRNSRRFPEHNKFIAALGANPFFMNDGRTTNEEAYAMMYPDVALKAYGVDANDEAAKREHKKKIFSEWRFECRDVAYRGAIVMSQFQHLSVGHNGGSNYYGPRSKEKSENWWMSIKLDLLDRIDYKEELDLPEYEIWGGAVTYNWKGIRDATGKTLGDYKMKSFGLPKNGGGGNSLIPFERAGAGSSQSSDLPNMWDDDYNNFISDFDTDDGFDRKFAPSSSGNKTEWLCHETSCDICNLDPGNEVYVNDKLACKHCGHEVDIMRVGIDEIMSGEYSPVNDNDWESIIDSWSYDDKDTIDYINQWT